MLKLTNGPWLVAEQVSGMITVVSSVGTVAAIGVGEHNMPDANLIASAPDMYAALDAADTAFAVLQVQDLGSQARGCVREAWPLVQSALAKAVPDSSYAGAVGEAQQHEIARLDKVVADLRDRLADIADVLKDFRGLPGSPTHYAHHVASGVCDDEA